MSEIYTVEEIELNGTVGDLEVEVQHEKCSDTFSAYNNAGVLQTFDCPTYNYVILRAFFISQSSTVEVSASTAAQLIQQQGPEVLPWDL